MSTPVRVIVQIMGATIFNTKQATMEWTPQGTLRIVQTEPGQQPVLLLDTPPSGLREIVSYTANQAMIVFKPVQGGAIKVSLQGSMLAPEPHESADAYAIRSATTGVPPQQWWVDSLAASGVTVKKFGWGKSWAIAGGVVAALVVFAVLVALLGNL